MAEKFSPYDSADYLNSLEDIAYYLEAALEEAGDDPAFITHAIGVIARSQNFSELARKVIKVEDLRVVRADNVHRQVEIASSLNRVLM